MCQAVVAHFLINKMQCFFNCIHPLVNKTQMSKYPQKPSGSSNVKTTNIKEVCAHTEVGVCVYNKEMYEDTLYTKFSSYVPGYRFYLS